METTQTVETKLITGEELFELPGVGSCELIDGRIVPMSPTGGGHGGFESALVVELGIFVRRQRIGYLASGEVGIYTGRNPDTVRGADIAVFTKAQLPAGLPRGYIHATPELVVEIVSPNDAWAEIRAKVREYFAIGTGRVWIVAPDERAVLVYRAPNEYTELAATDTLTGEGALTGFSLPVASIFDDLT
jgi:Uma2 family endonuclease